MSKMLGYCLTLGSPSAWEGFALVAAAQLSELEREALAYWALIALPPERAEATAAAACEAAGEPRPAFLGGMSDARAWADWASPSERKAYALAAFEAMSPQDQAAFYRHISVFEVAA